MSELPPMKVTVTFAWWWRPYYHALFFLAVLFGCVPDFEKLQRTMLRALRLRFE